MDTNTVTFDEWYDNEPGLKYYGGDYKGIANAAWNAARATALSGEERKALKYVCSTVMPDGSREGDDALYALRGLLRRLR
jgi:hypothetical protein